VNRRSSPDTSPARTECLDIFSPPVATENRIWAGADAAMGYPRFGMLDLLKLLSRVLVGVFRSHAAREAETAFLRQQLVVLQRSTPVLSQLAGNLGNFRDEFARDSPLQRRVLCEPDLLTDDPYTRVGWRPPRSLFRLGADRGTHLGQRHLPHQQAGRTTATAPQDFFASPLAAKGPSTHALRPAPGPRVAWGGLLRRGWSGTVLSFAAGQ
jgi:hypothetical protein